MLLAVVCFFSLSSVSADFFQLPTRDVATLNKYNIDPTLYQKGFSNKPLADEFCYEPLFYTQLAVCNQLIERRKNLFGNLFHRPSNSQCGIFNWRGQKAPSRKKRSGDLLRPCAYSPHPIHVFALKAVSARTGNVVDIWFDPGNKRDPVLGLVTESERGLFQQFFIYNCSPTPQCTGNEISLMTEALVTTTTWGAPVSELVYINTDCGPITKP